MDLKRLRTFVTVADQGSVSKAALCLRIAQPALSRQIADLETELGLKLFDRVGRRLYLTGEGEQLLGNCRSLLGSAISLVEQARLLRRGDVGLLKVAASPQIIESVFSAFLPRYADWFPNVQVKLSEAVGMDQLTMLQAGKVHVCIGLLSAVQRYQGELGTYPLPPVEFQVGQHRLGSAERSLRIDHPLGFAYRRRIRRERVAFYQLGVITEELQAARLVGRDQLLQEQPAEQPREHARAGRSLAGTRSSAAHPARCRRPAR